MLTAACETFMNTPFEVGEDHLCTTLSSCISWFVCYAYCDMLFAPSRVSAIINDWLCVTITTLRSVKLGRLHEGELCPLFWPGITLSSLPILNKRTGFDSILDSQTLCISHYGLAGDEILCSEGMVLTEYRTFIMYWMLDGDIATLTVQCSCWNSVSQTCAACDDKRLKYCIFELQPLILLLDILLNQKRCTFSWLQSTT